MMKRCLIPVIFAFSCHLYAATFNASPSQNVAAVQAIINQASPGDTVLFAPGTYDITAGLNLKCGVSYTAADPTTPSNVILSASFLEESSDVFALASGCTSPTTISYLSILHAGLIFVNTPNSNLTLTQNQVGDLKCCRSQAYSPAIYFNDPSSGSTNFLTHAMVSWNQLGDATSCVAPQNGMLDTDSPEDYEYICAAMTVQTSVNGMTIENNNVFHVAEGIHFLCYGDRCDPPNGPITKNVYAGFNDFSQVHRIPWEQQPESIQGVVFQFNSLHDWFDAYFGSFGLSFACCANPASSSPYLFVANNVISFNAQPSPIYGVYGYGIEGWGVNASYSNNWVGTTNYTWCAGISGCQGPGPGMASGYGVPSSMSYNTVCGPIFATYGYIVPEFPGSGLNPPAQVGDITTPSCSAVTSFAPTISPASGPETYPLTVTLTDPGYLSGPQPLGNTGIWYTTDGSTPVPGHGSARFLQSGGKFVLSSPATVKAVGMWGSRNQPVSYASGFGFTPSKVVGNTFTTASGKTLVSAYLLSKGRIASVPLGGTLQFIAYGVYSDGSVQALPDSMGNKVTAWNTSNHAVAKISTLGHATAMGLGTVTIEGFIGNLEATPSKMAVTPIVASSVEAPIAEEASSTMIQSPRSSPSTPSSHPIADTFIGPLWEAITPNGGSATAFDGRLIIGVPGGSNHDTLGASNDAARLVQPIGNSDFDVSIKIDSMMKASDAGTNEGLIALSDNGDFVSFALTSDGTNIGLLARTVTNGHPTTVFEDPTFYQYETPIYLRLIRSGVSYIASYSIDGAHWTQATNFTYSGSLAFIGPFVSNHNDVPESAPAAAMSVDWFNVG